MSQDSQTNFSISQKSVGIIVVGCITLMGIVAVFTGNEFIAMREDVRSNSTDVAVIKSQFRSIEKSFGENTRAVRELTRAIENTQP